MVHMQKYGFTKKTLWCWDNETMKYDAEERKGAFPSASHMDRSSMLTSFWLAFKNDHSAWLQLFFYRSGNFSVPSICLFSLPFYSSAMVMDDKAQGVSGVPWTKTLWPSALAWLCQSRALLTAEWNVEWFTVSSRDQPHVAKKKLQ